MLISCDGFSRATSWKNVAVLALQSTRFVDGCRLLAMGAGRLSRVISAPLVVALAGGILVMDGWR
jgi:hypothetical protein